MSITPESTENSTKAAVSHWTPIDVTVKVMAKVKVNVKVIVVSSQRSVLVVICLKSCAWGGPAGT